MDIRITYDDAYYKDDDKFIICIKNLSINDDNLGDKEIAANEPLGKCIEENADIKMYYELDPDWLLSDDATIKKIQDLVQALLDGYAHKMYYDNGFALAGYYDSSNTKFAAEAKAFVEFRDKCWTICYDFLNRYTSGEIRKPLPAEVLNTIYLQLGEYIHV